MSCQVFQYKAPKSPKHSTRHSVKWSSKALSVRSPWTTSVGSVCIQDTVAPSLCNVGQVLFPSGVWSPSQTSHINQMMPVWFIVRSRKVWSSHRIKGRGHISVGPTDTRNHDHTSGTAVRWSSYGLGTSRLYTDPSVALGGQPKMKAIESREFLLLLTQWIRELQSTRSSVNCLALRAANLQISSLST